MGYFFLILTIISETIAVMAMKLSNGFQNRWYSILAVVTYLAGFIFLTLCLKTMPAGLANAIWAGASTVLVAILGVYIFGEKLTALQIISIGFITLGLIGLNLKS